MKDAAANYQLWKLEREYKGPKLIRTKKGKLKQTRTQRRNAGKGLKKRVKLYMRQKGDCYYCKRQCIHPMFEDPKKRNALSFTLDHIIPDSNGGTRNYSNMVGACNACNSLRGNIPFDQWLEVIKLPRDKWRTVVKKIKAAISSSVAVPAP